MPGDQEIIAGFERVNNLLEKIATDLFGFIQICGMSDEYRAEQKCLEVLHRAIDRGDLEEVDSEMVYLREKLLTEVWLELINHVEPVQDTVFEHFYSMPQKIRAAVFLRHRIGLTFIAIGRILSMGEAEIRESVLSARERILGRPLAKIDWDF